MVNVQSGGPWTTTALGGAGTYTSRTLGLQSYGHLTGTVLADQAGTVFVDQSPDGTNWDYTSSFAVTAGVGVGFSVECVSKYARIRYVNGATPQGSMRLYTFLRGQ